MDDKLYHIHFAKANSRETYYTMHNVKAAHKYSKGAGINVGIIDWCFGFNENRSLYADGTDVAESPMFPNDKAEHGYWMACALREIAPECRIYAINCLNRNGFDRRAEYVVKAIQWAVKNNIDVLTYSNAMFNAEERMIVDESVEYAAEYDVITTFIHYDYRKNIYPGPMYNYRVGNREPDVRILHYDYNTLFIQQYEKYITININEIKSVDDIPYFSISSTSPVLAGFIAIMKSIDNSLKSDDCKLILQQTSYSTHFSGTASWENTEVTNVADIGAAAEFVFNNKYN